MIVVSDSTILIGLVKIEKLDLLKEIFINGNVALISYHDITII